MDRRDTYEGSGLDRAQWMSMGVEKEPFGPVPVCTLRGPGGPMGVGSGNQAHNAGVDVD